MGGKDTVALKKPHDIRLRALRTAGALLTGLALCSCAPAPAGNNSDSGPGLVSGPDSPEQADSPAQPDSPAASQQDPQPNPARAERITTRKHGKKKTVRITRCHTSQLAGSIKDPHAGAGQRGAELELRNKSKEACTLYGYGGLQLIDAAGKNLPTKLDRTPNPAPLTLSLRPGDAATTSLRWGAVGEPKNGACEATPARALVTPPDEQDPLTVNWDSGAVCDHGAITGTAYHK